MSELRHRRHREDAGYTVTEVLVTMLILSVVGAILLAVVVSMTESTTRESLNVQAQRELDQVMRQMSQDIRAADEINATYPTSGTCPTGGSFAAPNYSGYRSCLSFRIPRPTSGTIVCPYTQVVYGLRNGILRQDRTEFVLSGTSCVAGPTTTGKVLMRNVPAGTQLFSYFNSTGQDVLDDVSPATPPTDARSVFVNLATRYRQTGNAIARLTTSVALRNQR